MESDELLGLLRQTAGAIGEALDGLSDWGLAGTRPGQYLSDIEADRVGVGHLVAAGFGVLSEESGVHYPDRELFAVIDPVDGSTNASRRLPWFATSICVLDRSGPLAGYVINQYTKVSYEAYRGRGARRNGQTISPNTTKALSAAIVGLSGYPARHLGWNQYRVLGAIALDLCAVADGTLDGYLDCDDRSHGPWDYLAGMFICQEAGAFVTESWGRDLIARGHEDRRSPVAGGTQKLADELVTAYHDSVAG